jgi:hypothetical protein
MPRLFDEKSIKDLFKENDIKVKQKIDGVYANGLISDKASSYIESETLSIYNSCKINEETAINRSDIITDGPVMKDVTDFLKEKGDFVPATKRALRAVVQYHIGYKGNSTFFYCHPNDYNFQKTYSFSIKSVVVSQYMPGKGHLSFEIVTESTTLELSPSDEESVKKQAREVIEFIETALAQLYIDCLNYNGKLEETIREGLNTRARLIQAGIDQKKRLDPFG